MMPPTVFHMTISNSGGISKLKRREKAASHARAAAATSWRNASAERGLKLIRFGTNTMRLPDRAHVPVCSDLLVLAHHRLRRRPRQEPRVTRPPQPAVGVEQDHFSASQSPPITGSRGRS